MITSALNDLTKTARRKTTAIGGAFLSAVILLLVVAQPAFAASSYSTGFETDTGDWTNTTKVASNSSGFPAAGGSFYGQTTSGAFTKWGGYESTFPANGYTTSVDIYLNTAGGYANDTRFDWDSASSNNTGGFLRDFVFNGGYYNDSDATGTGSRFVFSASNNAGRGNSFPKNPGRDPYAVTTTGWYTFQHRFYNSGGKLAVDLSILDSGGTVLHTWTLSDPTDIIAANVGGHRYGWFPTEEFTSLGIDNADLSLATPVPACSASSSFDSFTNGSVNGQGGWSSTGPYDQAVVDNVYGQLGFGCKSLRMSNAVTSGSFGDQTFSYSTPDEAGEGDSTNGGQSGGTRQTHYDAQFDIASAQPSVQQTGLALSVSPDRGDGSRMSYLRFEDQADGVHVFFDDVQGTGSSTDFVETEIATLDRTVAHTAKFSIDFADGPSNDVVKIYIDGNLVHTGTTWENYYRYDPESSAEQSPRTIDSLLFRAAGTAAPANSGKGFLFDNVNIATSTPDTTAPATPAASPPAGTYTSAQSVSLTSSDSDSGLAGIYYTTDGTTPNNTGNGTLYSGPISVGTSETIKAIAYDNAGNASPVLTAAYTIDTSSSGGGSGSGGGSSSSGNTGGSGSGSGTNTATSGGRGGGFFGGFGTDTGQVLGITTTSDSDKSGEKGHVKSESTSKDNTAKKSDNKAFAGLGWWWLLVLAALLAALYYAYTRFRQNDES